jgi:hypothetical protein
MFLTSDLISILLGFGYVFVRFFGIPVPLVNYYFIKQFSLSPAILISFT